MEGIIRLFVNRDRDSLLIIGFISGLLISAFILPSSLMDVFNSGPALWFKLILALFLIQFTIYYIIKPVQKVVMNFNVIDFLILISIILVLLQSLFLNISINKAVIFYLLIITYYIIKILFSNINTSEKKFTYFTIVAIFSLVALISSTIGICQIANILPSNNLYFKVTGNFKNPARFATYLSSLLPIPFCFYIIYQNKVPAIRHIKTITSFALLAGLLVLPSTYSRSSWLGLAVVIV
ncbi:MAG: hypothetical protein EOP34_06905, partial [Rickettsiales bacterium]